MATQPQLTETPRSSWLRNVALRNGIYTGIHLSCVLVAWLVVANRVPELERYAGIRNVAGLALFASVMAIPVLRFRHEPGQLMASGLTALTLLSLTYRVAEVHFTLLAGRAGALHIFMLGAVSYGLLAVLAWIFQMCAVAHQEHVAHSRAAAAPAGRQHTN
jgi:hypothetical protein